MVQGNFCLVGSIANLIVAEKAAAAGEELTFARHFKFASWSCILIIFVGDLILFYCVRPFIAYQLEESENGSGSI
eukprot:COSAG02_NODE_9377_length_2237_cov_1.503742_1_plen_75_part_00